MHKHLRRLERVWADAPIYFVTTCTKNRRAVLAQRDVAQILIEEWRLAHACHGWCVGRYVVMPDHVHFFCRSELDARTLSEFVGAWKRWTNRKINALDGLRSATAAGTLWQPEFFDHVLRSGENYGEKWIYVFDNPVRAGLVTASANWPFAGEIETLML